MGRDEAEMIAVQALGFLAADPERLSRFIDLSGLGPTNLRAAAAEPGFLRGVLDYLVGDDTLLTMFAANDAIDPTHVTQAHLALAGRPPE